MFRWFPIGPHAFFDLVRLARRGRSTLVRIGYLLALLAALSWESARHEEWRRFSDSVLNERARLAEWYSFTVLLGQNLAVLILMPIYAAGSMHEERDRRTLPLLLSTQLTATEIVLGKLVSRIGHVGGVLLAGLPVLSLVQLWGGIDMPTLALAFGQTAFLLFSVGAISLAIAVWMRGFIASIFTTYIILTILVGCSLPSGGYFAIPLRDTQPLTTTDTFFSLAIVAAFCVSVSCLSLGLAVLGLNCPREEKPPVQAVAPHLRLPPVSDSAVLWKERYCPRALFCWALPIAWLVPIGSFVMIWLALRLEGQPWRETARKDMEGTLLFIMLASFTIYLLLVTLRLTGCIVGERQRGTLEALLLLPLSTEEFLWQKFAGSLLRYWTWLLPFATSWLVLFLFGEGVAVGGLLFVLPIHLTFFAGLGLFLSVVCRSSLAAYISLGLVLLTLFGTILIPPTYSLFDYVNPVRCWLFMCGWGSGSVESVLGNGMLYVVAALWLIGQTLAVGLPRNEAAAR
jgi:ABC-type transport system involved in multi-copper enzyme maturation permease subunit